MGPVTTVNGHHRVPWAIAWVIRGRCSAQSCGTSGAVTLEARIGSLTKAAGRLAPAATRFAAWAAIGTSAGMPAGPLGPAASGHLTRTPTKSQPGRTAHPTIGGKPQSCRFAAVFNPNGG